MVRKTNSDFKNGSRASHAAVFCLFWTCPRVPHDPTSPWNRTAHLWIQIPGLWVWTWSTASTSEGCPVLWSLPWWSVSCNQQPTSCRIVVSEADGWTTFILLASVAAGSSILPFQLLRGSATRTVIGGDDGDRKHQRTEMATANYWAVLGTELSKDFQQVHLCVCPQWCPEF